MSRLFGSLRKLATANFQDRLVMSCCGARNFLFALAHKISTAATPYASLLLPLAALGNVPTSNPSVGMMQQRASYLRSLEDGARRACSSNPLSLPHSEIDKLAVACAECGYLRRRRTIPLMHTVHFPVLSERVFIISRVTPNVNTKTKRIRQSYFSNSFRFSDSKSNLIHNALSDSFHP